MIYSLFASSCISNFTSQILPYTLKPNTVYTFQVTAAIVSDKSLFSSAVTTVIVGTLGVKALISGGSSRTGLF